MAYTVTDSELAHIAYLADVEGDDIRTDYSGRGMYGNKCVGFVTNSPMKVAAAMFEVQRQMESEGLTSDFVDVEFLRFMETAEMDSMGRRTIVYFPELTLN